jgi:hypothetical protein
LIMLILINKFIIVRLFVATIAGAILPFVIYNFIATGRFDFGFKSLAFVSLHYLIGVLVVYYLLKRIYAFNFWSFALVGVFVFYATAAVYSFIIGYGWGSLIFPLFLSIFAMPSILITWFILKPIAT